MVVGEAIGTGCGCDTVASTTAVGYGFLIGLCAQTAGHGRIGACELAARRCRVRGGEVTIFNR